MPLSFRGSIANRRYSCELRRLVGARSLAQESRGKERGKRKKRTMSLSHADRSLSFLSTRKSVRPICNECPLAFFTSLFASLAHTPPPAPPRLLSYRAPIFGNRFEKRMEPRRRVHGSTQLIYIQCALTVIKIHTPRTDPISNTWSAGPAINSLISK